jgi:ribosomal protein S18 acetylase RimI-like enzyme
MTETLPKRGKTEHNAAAMRTTGEITIRAARPADAAAIADIDVETWQATYAGILGTPYLAGLSPQRRESGWSSVIRRAPNDVHVAVDRADDVIGFGSCGASRGDPDFTAEVFTLYVAPDWQNQGVGRRLLLAMFRRLVATGHRRAIIWVLRENPSRFFYQRLGGKEVRRKLLPFNGAEVAASGYGWTDLPGYLAANARAAGESEA